MGKEYQILEEGSKEEIHRDSLRATVNEIPDWKIPGHDGIHGFWFKNSHQSMTD